MMAIEQPRPETNAKQVSVYEERIRDGEKWLFCLACNKWQTHEHDVSPKHARQSWYFMHLYACIVVAPRMGV